MLPQLDSEKGALPLYMSEQGLELVLAPIVETINSFLSYTHDLDNCFMASKQILKKS